MKIITVGRDLAKNIFQVHGITIVSDHVRERKRRARSMPANDCPDL